MAENYFDKIDREKEEMEARRQAEIQAANNEVASEERQIRELQWQRDKEHLGIEPAKVWGSEDARLCRDFLEYMDKRRVNGILPGSIEINNSGNRFREAKYEYPNGLLANLGLRRPKLVSSTYDVPEWSIRGYRIAFSNSRPVYSNTPFSPDFTIPDVVLCEDGLLRREDSARSLLLADVNGAVHPPECGSRIQMCSKEKVDTVYVFPSSPAAGTEDVFKTTYYYRFEPATLEATLVSIIKSLE